MKKKLTSSEGASDTLNMAIDQHTKSARAVLKEYQESGQAHVAFATGSLIQVVKHLIDGLKEAHEENNKLKERIDKLEKPQG